MVDLGAMIDRVNEFEKALDQKLQKVQRDFDLDKREELIEKVKLERHRKFNVIIRAFQAFSSKANAVISGTKLQSADTLKSFEESLEELKAIESDVPEEQQRELSKVGLQVLESNIQLVENLLSREIASQVTSQSQKELHELRNKAERMWRLTLLTVPSSEQEFEATIMWASEQGEDIELITLQNLNSCLPYDSDKIRKLLEYAKEQIAKRIHKEAKSYKVLCSPKQLEQHFQGVQIIKVYPTFTVISALSKTIADIKMLFPVKRWEPSDEPQLSGESAITDNQYQATRFKTLSPQFVDEQRKNVHQDADVTETFAIALIKDHQPDEAFYVDQRYRLQAGIRSKLFLEFDSESIQIFNQGELIQLEIVVWAEEMEIEPDWTQSCLFRRTEETSLVEFKLKPTQVGYKEVRVEFLHQRHWLAKIVFSVEVIEASIAVLPL